MFSNRWKKLYEATLKSEVQLINQNSKFRKIVEGQMELEFLLDKLNHKGEFVVFYEVYNNQPIAITMDIKTNSEKRIEGIDIYLYSSFLKHIHKELQLYATAKGLCDKNNSIYIIDLTTVPNKGYGSKAMNIFLNLLVQFKFKTVLGELSPVDYTDHPERLEHFYKKFGFEILPGKLDNQRFIQLNIDEYIKLKSSKFTRRFL